MTNVTAAEATFFFLLLVALAAVTAILEHQMWNLLTTHTWVPIVLVAVAVVAIVQIRTRRFRDGGAVDEFRNVLWLRYTGGAYKAMDRATEAAAKINIQDADRLIAHLDRIVDRQINKARGILPFNSILLAVFTFERDRLDSSRVSLFLLIAGLVASSLFCLHMFLVQWSGGDSYSSFSKEVDVAVRLASRRSISIEWAAWISGACLLIGAMIIVIAEVNFAAKPSTPAKTASTPTGWHCCAPLRLGNLDVSTEAVARLF